MTINPQDAAQLDPRTGMLVAPARYDAPEGAQPVDIAFVYCLDVEEDAVRSRYFAGASASFRPYPPTYRRIGRTVHRHRGRTYQLAACKASDAGPLAMMTALIDLHRHFSPRVTCLVGIAGGLDPSLALGSVVLAERVLYYERGKESAGGVQRELRPFSMPADARNLLDGVVADLRRDNNAPDVRWGTYGTGEKVLADQLGDAREYLRTVDRKIAAVEMESGGFFHHFDQDPDFRRAGQTWLMVKGISDHADAAKDDSRQPEAADNSAKAALYLATGLLDELGKAQRPADRP